MITIFIFTKKETLCFCVSSLLLQKSVEKKIRTSILCVCVFFFRKRLPRNFIGLIRPVSVPRCTSIEPRCTSIEPRLRKERLARVSICLHNKRGFDHVDSERTFYTYIQVAICFSSWNRFDPLPHSSGSDITPFLSPYLTLPCPESWFPIALPLSLQQHTHI